VMLLMLKRAMITITIKGLSKEAHQALKQRAHPGPQPEHGSHCGAGGSVRSTPADNSAVIQRAVNFATRLNSG